MSWASDVEEEEQFHSDKPCLQQDDAFDDVQEGFLAEKTRIVCETRANASSDVSIFAGISPSDRVPIHVRKRFVDARLAMGHTTRTSLAKAIGVTVTVVTSIESGKALWSDVESVVRSIVIGRRMPR